MPGMWLARLGERICHGETFALIVSPAIADLQFEAPTGHAHQARHYVAVWKAFALALCCDTAGDIHSLRDDLPTVVSLTLLQAFYYSFLLLLLSGFGSGRLEAQHLDETTAAYAASFVAAIALLCLIPTLASFWPPRRAPRSDPAE